MDELEEINKKYQDISVGIYPFINKNRITVLKRGFYRKDKADYRGVSMIWDKYEHKSKAMLLGYYYVPKNYIVVPNSLEITPGKEKLINSKINKGYEVVNNLSLKPYEFSKNTKEYNVARKLNRKHRKNLVA